jgi:hypothetical protein
MFSELMKNLAGVKSFVFGGRPHKGPMQALGGTKGQMVIGDGMMPLMYNTVIEVAENATKRGEPTLTEAQINQLKEIAPLSDEASPLSGLNTLSINFLNGYHADQPDMSVQFIYELADYRLFYTPENLFDPATAWAAAVRAHCGNGPYLNGSESMHASHHRRAMH